MKRIIYGFILIGLALGKTGFCVTDTDSTSSVKTRSAIKRSATTGNEYASVSKRINFSDENNNPNTQHLQAQSSPSAIKRSATTANEQEPASKRIKKTLFNDPKISDAQTFQSRVYRQTANYTLTLNDKRTFECQVDNCHKNLKERLNTIIKDHRLERNAAVAVLSLLVEKDGELQEISIDAPHIYLSGRDCITKTTVAQGSTYGFRCFGDLTSDEENLDFIRNFISRMIYATPDETALEKTLIKSVIRQIGLSPNSVTKDHSPIKTTTPPELRRLSHRNCIPEHYSHSEQVLVYDLVHHLEILLDPFHAMPEITGATIHQLRVDICSSNEVCRKCGTSLFRLGENAENFKDKLNACFKEKGYAIPTSGIHFFKTATGLRKYDAPRKPLVAAELKRSPLKVHVNGQDQRVLQARLS